MSQVAIYKPFAFYETQSCNSDIVGNVVITCLLAGLNIMSPHRAVN